VFLPSRRVEEAVRDGAPLPAPLPALLSGACSAVLAQTGPVAEPTPPVLQRVAAGSLGTWVGGGGRAGETA
jgi:hypothetical protein